MLLETPICEFDKKIQPFILSDYDNKSYQFNLKSDKNAYLVMFICNHCPYVKAIIKNLVSDIKKLQEISIEVVAIMSNDYTNYSDDSPQRMKEFAINNNFTFPYLIDESQEVAKIYDAVCTPDFFGFNKKGELKYRGRLDNFGIKTAELESQEMRQTELYNAMKMIAKTGSGPKQQNPSMGCSIKWK